MTSIEHYDLLLLAIKNSNVLSSSQKEILIHLLQFKEGLPMSDLVELMGQSKQTLFLKVKKLLDRGFVLREKDMVFMYKVNQQKMSTLLENYQQLQNHKVLK
jgi:predicted transcriptional regulator